MCGAIPKPIITVMMATPGLSEKSMATHETGTGLILLAKLMQSGLAGLLSVRVKSQLSPHKKAWKLPP